MKKRIKLLVLILLATVFSCKPAKEPSGSSSSSNEPVQTNTSAPEDTSGEKMPLIVSFYSIGSGIDRGEPEKMFQFIEVFSKKFNKKVTYSEVNWGREGERDYCFPLTGFTETEAGEFIKEVKATLSSAEHVHFVENQPCRQPRK